MSDSELEFFGPDVKKDISYKVCMGGWAGAGLLTGSFYPVVGSVVGLVGGLAWGLLTCGMISPVIEKKLFSKNDVMTEKELGSFVLAVKRQTGIKSQSDALKLAAIVRQELGARGRSTVKENPHSMAFLGMHILKKS